MNGASLNCRCDPKMLTELQKISTATGVSVGRLTRCAVSAFLKRSTRASKNGKPLTLTEDLTLTPEELNVQT